jgi:hypothetical protein
MFSLRIRVQQKGRGPEAAALFRAIDLVYEQYQTGPMLTQPRSSQLSGRYE